MLVDKIVVNLFIISPKRNYMQNQSLAPMQFYFKNDSIEAIKKEVSRNQNLHGYVVTIGVHPITFESTAIVEGIIHETDPTTGRDIVSSSSQKPGCPYPPECLITDGCIQSMNQKIEALITLQQS
jgi:hypothetical protein